MLPETQAAIDAINRVFGDTRRTKQETLAEMEEIFTVVEANIGALEEEIAREERESMRNDVEDL